MRMTNLSSTNSKIIQNSRKNLKNEKVESKWVEDPENERKKTKAAVTK